MADPRFPIHNTSYAISGELGTSFCINLTFNTISMSLLTLISFCVFVSQSPKFLIAVNINTYG